MGPWAVRTKTPRKTSIKKTNCRSIHLIADIVLFTVCNYLTRAGVENEGGYIGEDEAKRHCGTHPNRV